MTCPESDGSQNSSPGLPGEVHLICQNLLTLFYTVLLTTRGRTPFLWRVTHRESFMCHRILQTTLPSESSEPLGCPQDGISGPFPGSHPSLLEFVQHEAPRRLKHDFMNPKERRLCLKYRVGHLLATKTLLVIRGESVR